MMPRLEQDTYDLILLDLNLGVEDGLDLLRELHARGRSRIIVIKRTKESGRQSSRSRIGSRRLGVQAISSARSAGAREKGAAFFPRSCTRE